MSWLGAILETILWVVVVGIIVICGIGLWLGAPGMSTGAMFLECVGFLAVVETIRSSTKLVVGAIAASPVATADALRRAAKAKGGEG
jgi:hypothetical protein